MHFPAAQISVGAWVAVVVPVGGNNLGAGVTAAA